MTDYTLDFKSFGMVAIKGDETECQCDDVVERTSSWINPENGIPTCGKCEKPLRIVGYKEVNNEQENFKASRTQPWMEGCFGRCHKRGETETLHYRIIGDDCVEFEQFVPSVSLNEFTRDFIVFPLLQDEDQPTKGKDYVWNGKELKELTTATK